MSERDGFSQWWNVLRKADPLVAVMSDAPLYPANGDEMRCLL